MLDNLTVNTLLLPEAQSFRYKRIKDYIYDMQTVLGKGSFSTVYKGVREKTNQPLAVKVVKLKSLTFKKLEELLQQEISVICSLQHPNIIRCFEVLKSCNHCYFVILQTYLKQKGSAFKQEEIQTYVRDILQGLKYLAQKSIIHRDIKTANVFLKNGVAKIADFGFAVQTKQPFYDLNIGSPLYMSPQGYLSNRYGPKTDIWAFGVVIYELLHGFPPLLNCKSQEDLKYALTQNIKDNQIRPDVSRQLRQLIRRCLQIDEHKRISLQQIQRSNYFKKNVSSKKAKQNRQLRIKSISINYPQSLQNIQIIMHPPVKKQSTYMTPKSDRKQNKQNQLYQFKMTKNKLSSNSNTLEVPSLYSFQSNHSGSNNSILIQCGQKQIILGKITFNQAIGLIHYCRLGFKLAQQKIGKQSYSLIGIMNVKLLEQLLVKINLGLIFYTESQNKQQKKEKLQNVTKQYLFKYKKMYKTQNSVLCISKLRLAFEKQLNQIEKKVEINVYCSYLVMLYYVFTGYLQWCILHRNYCIFGQDGVIQTCLHEQNLPKTKNQYYMFKSKYQNLHPNERTNIK